MEISEENACKDGQEVRVTIMIMNSALFLVASLSNSTTSSKVNEATALKTVALDISTIVLISVT